MRTGPGRPPRAWRVASAIACGTRSGIVELDGVDGEPPDRRGEVDLLEGLPPAERSRHLADDGEQRGRVGSGGVDADGEVGGPDRAGREAGGRPAGQLAVRLGHERGTALVTGRHDPDAGVGQRVEQAEEALTGDGEGDPRHRPRGAHRRGTGRRSAAPRDGPRDRPPERGPIAVSPESASASESESASASLGRPSSASTGRGVERRSVRCPRRSPGPAPPSPSAVGLGVDRRRGRCGVRPDVTRRPHGGDDLVGHAAQR